MALSRTADIDLRVGADLCVCAAASFCEPLPPDKMRRGLHLQASSPPFFDLRLRERRFDPRLFALRLAERLAFLLPPFFAAAFLREERLFGAMVQTTRNYGCNTTASN